jgi:two-component system sensor histidine kinase MprB
VSLRSRISIAAAVAVAISFVVGSFAVHLIVRKQLRDQIDDSLRTRAAVVQNIVRQQSLQAGPGAQIQIPDPAFGEAPGVFQVVGTQGAPRLPARQTAALPVGQDEREVAAGKKPQTLHDVTLKDTHLRMLTVPVAPNAAIQIARPLTETDRTLRHLTTALVIVSLGGIVLAFLLGRMVSRTALMPVRKLTEATEHVAATHDLGERIEEQGDDELGRLASSFNGMLEALDQSVGAQRRLVADASHELRTPLTSMRTNIEVLERAHDMPPDERRRLLDDMLDQQAELAALVTDLIDLARGAEPEGTVEDVSIDDLARSAIERAERHSPEVTFESQLSSCAVSGDRARLDRALSNLLDNAAKWTRPGTSVVVTVGDGQLTVRDHGPGFAAADLPHVFDRFYRAANARGMPGSGLGLAIVRQVVEGQGGTISAENASGGGALMRWTFASA